MNATTGDAQRISLISLPGIPPVKKGDDLIALIRNGLNSASEQLSNGDVIVLAQKIVSKAQGRQISLESIKASDRAVELATKCDKDPRLVELILRESAEVLRVRPGVIVVAHRLGFVLANAGIDRSNVDDNNSVLLLPENPDRTALELRKALKHETGFDVGVIINDSLGRAWRNGTIGTALGVSGVSALADLRGTPDMFGRPLQTTEVGHADEIAAAASLLMGQSNQRRPIVIIKGLSHNGEDGAALDLVRDRKLDMFR